MDEKRVAVRRMQDYIKKKISQKISLKDLSASVNLSPSYATKIFKEETGYTPYHYIKALRLSEAARVLRDQNIKVIDVALDYVFDSHEGFTRAFSKQFGLPPKQYAKEKPPIQWFLPYPVQKSSGTNTKSNDLLLVSGSKEEIMEQFIFTQVIERPRRKALILRARTAREYFKYCEEVGCDVWGILMSVKEALYEPAGFWLPDYLVPAGTSKYVQGVEVPEDYDNIIPEGFELIDLEPYKAMIFQGQPYDDDNFQKAVSSMMEAMDSFDPRLYGYEYAPEKGPRFQLEPRGERGYIEGRPVVDMI